jgi:nicotinate-nucleotide pyrophosphorylase (carboxylating)
MEQQLLAQAFAEDLPHGDLTTDALKRKEKFGIAKLIAKQDLVLSGSSLFSQAFHFLDESINLRWHFQDGDSVFDRQVVAQIEGNLVNVIKAERVALNFLGYLSGVATQAHQFQKACEGTDCKILDTRKTLPLYRALVKKAVVDGGACNHRMNLSDAILIKENHISIAGDLDSCLNQIKSHTKSSPIEIEVKNLTELKRAIEHDVARVMLDNFSLEDIQAAMEMVPQGLEVEASGNMTLERVPEVAKTGVHFISVGALTHSVPVADFSLLFDWQD